MDQQKKSMELANLMGWEVKVSLNPLKDFQYSRVVGEMQEPLIPYCSDSAEGLAQFAAIILKYYAPLHLHISKRALEYSNIFLYLDGLTQRELLDEILQMKDIQI